MRHAKLNSIETKQTSSLRRQEKVVRQKYTIQKSLEKSTFQISFISTEIPFILVYPRNVYL